MQNNNIFLIKKKCSIKLIRNKSFRTMQLSHFNSMKQFFIKKKSKIVIVGFNQKQIKQSENLF